jgi:hypothetical protein
MNKIRIFDIDGTITHPGIDLWYMTTRSLSSDIESFEKYVLAWKKEIRAGLNAYKTSKSMMLKGLNLMPLEITGNDIKLKAKKISKNIIKNGNYFESAIKHINNSIEKGFYVIFSTTNYYESGLGFLDALVECNQIGKNNINSILVSGSRIDWEDKKIIHFNMGDCKIKDICERLNLTEQDLIGRIDSFYVDDPEGNDSALLKLPLKGFVIKNDKNKNCLLPKHVLLTDWHEIIRYYP